MNDEMKRDYLNTDLTEGTCIKGMGLHTFDIFATVVDDSKVEELKAEQKDQTTSEKCSIYKCVNAANCFDYCRNPTLMFSDQAEVRKHESF